MRRALMGSTCMTGYPTVTMAGWVAIRISNGWVV